MRPFGERNRALAPWLPTCMSKDRRFAPLQPAFVVRQYTGDGLTPPVPARRPVVTTSKGELT
ncbi:MAG TPA: hypothetical protein VN213_03480 [Solirubrobacteraceae bacterium]|nr:hypothetical protein [Solirubrobacteraceae bacterium]